MKRVSIALALPLLFCLPGNAAAQGFVNPFVATTLSSPTADGGHSKAGFGVAFGNIGQILGAEAEIAYFPEVIDNTVNAIARNRVLTLSGNLLLGPTIGRLKVYGAAGAGDLRLNVTSLSSLVKADANSISNDYFSVNIGGGAMGFFSSHVGIRGDLRYYRSFGLDITDLEGSGLILNHFDFWRAGIGLVAKF